MLVWATEFVLASNNSCGDVLGVVKGWLASSPHSRWQTDSFGEDPLNNLTQVELDGQIVTIGQVETDIGQWSGAQYYWIEKGEREWITEVVAHAPKSKDVLVSVRVHCNGLVPGVDIPSAKKPQIVRRLLADLGGGDDAGLKVNDRPRLLAETDVDVATKVVTGTAKNRLPVVYVSVGKGRRPYVNADTLAQWLGGMAHVVVEPSRYFSFVLARNTGRLNAYDGAVSIYWPTELARQVRYLPAVAESGSAMQTKVAHRVQKALTQIRPESVCTFVHLKELISRARIDSLKAAGSTELAQYVEAFDDEFKAKDERIKELERELARRSAELRRYDEVGNRRGGLLKRGDEREFYPGETADAILCALKHGQSLLASDGRRAHIVSDVLQANVASTTESQIEEEIRDAFSETADMGEAQQRTLEDLGFVIEDSGKHVKATYQGDGRYTFVVSRTSSDRRAGKNLVSTILQKLFK